MNAARLLVAVAGWLLLLIGLSGIVVVIALVVFAVTQWIIAPSELGILLLGMLVASLAAMACGVALVGLARRQRRRRIGTCRACSYDLRGAEARCPECGTRF